MKHLIMTALLLLLMATLAAEVLPEQQSAPLVRSESPPVRYWSTSGQGLLPVQTLVGFDTPSQVPPRKDPKLLVVLYHNIVFGRTGNVYNRDLYNFEHDLAFLKRNFTITNFRAILTGTSLAKTDQVIITFDDGDLSIYAIVYPLFRQYELEATIFLVPNFIGEVGYMSWDQIREMSEYRTASGKKLFFFESHSLTHRMMGEMDAQEVRHELETSKQIIEEQIGEKVTVLALPFGSGAGDGTIINEAYDLG
jgi:peptidoglycan/xylan/chitin deacetylase (PgdA/CDA1 family)